MSVILHKLRPGLRGKLAWFVGLTLAALISVILAITIKQQEDALSDRTLREVTRYLSPVEALTLEIDQTAENLIRVEALRLQVERRGPLASEDRDYYATYFSRDALEGADEILRASIRASENGEPIDEARYNYLKNLARGLAVMPERSGPYAMRRKALEESLSAAVEYNNRIELAFRGLDLRRYRAESINVYRWPRFDTALLLAPAERRAAPINDFLWGREAALKSAMDAIYTPYYEGQRPLIAPQQTRATVSGKNYLLVSRTLFRNPEVSERALAVQKALNEQPAWRRYAQDELRFTREFAELAGKIRARLKFLKAANPPIPPYADAELRELFSAYGDRTDERRALLDEFRLAAIEKQDPRFSALLEELRALRRELAGLNRRENAARVDQVATRIGEIKQAIPDAEFNAEERFADAFEFLRDAALYRAALIPYRADQDAYASYVRAASDRRDWQARWNYLREWILSGRTETSLNMRRAGWALPALTREEAQELMFALDATPAQALAERLLFENTAGFTRILVDPSDYERQLYSERSRFADVAVSIGARIFFLAFLISGFLAGAIRQIIAGAARVGRGDLSVKFAYKGRDELGDLAQALNSMVSDLKDREELRGELTAAEEIQKRLIPDAPPAGFEEDLSFGAFYKAMHGVGGDYFDYVAAGPREFVFCVADVSNHGVGPAIVMTLMRSQLHAIVRRGERNPLQIVLELNERAYLDTPENIFITLFLGVYNADSGVIRYVSCGHTPAFIVNYKDGGVSALPTGGLPIGAVDNDMFRELVAPAERRLAPGDLFFQYTDGVTEAMNAADEQFGEGRLKSLLGELHRKKPSILVQAIAEVVQAFSGKRVLGEGPTDLNDDIAMLAFRRLR